MIDRVILGLDFGVGSALGVIFYGGLWWTVRRLPTGRPGTLLLGSFALRTLVVLAGFYTIARGPWWGMAACVAGFLGARIGVTYVTRTRATGDVGTAP